MLFLLEFLLEFGNKSVFKNTLQKNSRTVITGHTNSKTTTRQHDKGENKQSMRLSLQGCHGLAFIQSFDKLQCNLWAMKHRNISIKPRAPCRWIDLPISGFHRNLLIQQFASLLKHEMTSLRLASLSSAKCSDEHSFTV